MIKMDLNNRQQEKFSMDNSSLYIEQIDGKIRGMDFVEVEKAIKDFCYIRNELSNYSYLYASQLSFDVHLILPYWEYLFVKGQIDKHDKDELEEGALLVIYLMFAELFEEEGWCFLHKHNLFEKIHQTVEKYVPDSDRKKKIVDCIKFSFDNYANEKIDDSIPNAKSNELYNRLKGNNKWVYQEFVEKYYVEKANSFKPRQQATKSFFDSLLKRKK
jgi:hypothetical protein